MNNIINGACIHCGAPITSEICPYCGAPTGLDTQDADMEYPELKCKSSNINFWTFVFPMIFAVSFGFFGFVFPFIFNDNTATLICVPFMIISIAALFIALTPVFRNILLKAKGETISAIVYGYVDGDVILNGVPVQLVKLLVNTEEGMRFIFYNTGTIRHAYKINSRIDIIMYKNYFLIK